MLLKKDGGYVLVVFVAIVMIFSSFNINDQSPPQILEKANAQLQINSGYVSITVTHLDGTQASTSEFLGRQHGYNGQITIFNSAGQYVTEIDSYNRSPNASYYTLPAGDYTAEIRIANSDVTFGQRFTVKDNSNTLVRFSSVGGSYDVINYSTSNTKPKFDEQETKQVDTTLEKETKTDLISQMEKQTLESSKTDKQSSIIIQKPPFTVLAEDETEKVAIPGTESITTDIFSDSNADRTRNASFGESTSRSILGAGLAASYQGYAWNFQVPNSGEYQITWDDVLVVASGQARRMDVLETTGAARAEVKVILQIREQDTKKVVAEYSKILAQKKDPEEFLFETVDSTIFKLGLTGGEVLIAQGLAKYGAAPFAYAFFAKSAIEQPYRFFSSEMETFRISDDYNLKFYAEKGKTYVWLFQITTSAISAGTGVSAAEAIANADTIFANKVTIEPINIDKKSEIVKEVKKEKTCFLWIFCW